jgi:hypothetical protein
MSHRLPRAAVVRTVALTLVLGVAASGFLPVRAHAASPAGGSITCTTGGIGHTMRGCVVLNTH